VIDWGEPVAKWKVPANAGRVFSRIANDPNPIHMSAITAKLFGFKQAIAHGMFSVGRCVAMIQKDHPVDGPFQVDVRFKRPLFIPGAVALHTIVDDEGTKFLLKVQPKGEPNVEGRIARL
jgi:acyl dehydratase